ncbi:MAG: zinc ribbon domain-containing protein [Clostridia bacterium]|jgi:hypothetical protein|nr:zinc ribbon domain-containing protein [Clostridia bacterium]MBR0436563.1 zinc ribbon domain-containing protein [Clostridia bacterium]MBR2645595.1 zinc ribbon domain-containing protein [Clostridia bacterium]MBR3038055.1 zinc ribbon domain-containing protein [Clostridia bacterium]MBR3130178.1 zinc ribbon domain-containing protein [Clostridia bacterium]
MTMYCTKCGKQLPDDAAFCDACGARFAPEPSEPELQFDPPKTKAEPKQPEVSNAFRKWVKEQGLFCLIAKAVAVTVMTFYLLVAIVHMISLAVAGYPGGTIFAQFFAELLQGLSYGVIIWLLSDAVLYLQNLLKIKKQELKNK